MSNNSIISTTAVVGVTAACSFILLGNAITQSFMGVPALLVDFPRPPSSSSSSSTLSTSPEIYHAAARKLGRQWPVFWNMGNVFFRPISTLGIFGYGYAAWASLQAISAPLVVDFGGVAGSGSSGLVTTPSSWKLYALGAACHFVTVLHSVINMQPINEKIDGLKSAGMGRGTSGMNEDKDEYLAEYWARRWIRLNTVRIVMPALAGTLALVGALRGR